MKKIFSYIFALAVLVSCSQKEDFQSDSACGLLDVTFTAGTASPDSKVWAGWDNGVNGMFWSQSDKVGIFAGSDNVNCEFSLTSGADSPKGSFSGRMKPVQSPVTLYVYYPYQEGAESDYVAFPNLSEQVFEGTFDEQGIFSNIGEYSFLFNRLNNFTLTENTPSTVQIGFIPLVSLVRFSVSNLLASPLQIKSIGMISYNYSFIQPSYLNMVTGGFSGYYTSRIYTTISDNNPLIIGNSETKYVQMTAFYSNFSNETIDVFVDGIDGTGRNVRYTIPKNVTSNMNLDYGKRTTVSVPLRQDTPSVSASRIKVTTSSSTKSLKSPVFVFGAGYEAADVSWGDSTIQRYEAGMSHTFTTAGEHTSSFNHWGKSGAVYLETLSGIQAIDFSEVY